MPIVREPVGARVLAHGRNKNAVFKGDVTELELGKQNGFFHSPLLAFLSDRIKSGKDLTNLSFHTKHQLGGGFHIALPAALFNLGRQ